MKRRASLEASPDRQGAGARFRVRVSMERFFSDERALAYVCVRGDRRVRWLQRRLRAQFALPSHLALLCAGHLLPPDEPLALLRPDDRVDVVPSHVDLDKHTAEGADDVDSAYRTVSAIPEFGMGDYNVSVSNTVSDVTNRRSLSTDCVSKVVYVGDATPEPSRTAQEHDDDDDLSERKRRALLLLEQCCENNQLSEPQTSRPRRRRVRRRRRELPAPPPVSAPEGSLGPSPEQSPAPASLVPCDQEAVVLRNGIQIPRTPRLIRPLADVVSS